MFKRKSKQGVGESETLKSLRNTMKGYIGYNEVRERGPTDKALRNYLYSLVLNMIDKYSQVQNQLMQGQLLSTWSSSNQILTMLTDLRNFLSSDVYRHSTFFETPNIFDNIEVSILYLLESETILEMRSLIDLMEKTAERLKNLDLTDIEQNILAIRDSVIEVKTTITDRAELIASFEIVGLD